MFINYLELHIENRKFPNDLIAIYLKKSVKGVNTTHVYRITIDGRLKTGKIIFLK